MTNLQQPLRLEFKKAVGQSSKPMAISAFTSYSFDTNILTPASAFRFTAPGVDKSLRLSIRSGDNVRILCKNQSGTLIPIATGIIDETDTHILPSAVDYVITGRDGLSQLVDNSAIDSNNDIIFIKEASLDLIVKTLIKGTRLEANGYKLSEVPNGVFLFQTNPGETKINALQRYLDLCNSLVWSTPNGSIVVGKPNFTAPVLGSLILNSTKPELNNIMEARVRRSWNLCLRKIVTQQQDTEASASLTRKSFTKQNSDRDISPLIDALVGRSIYQTFSYAQGPDASNQIKFVGNSGSPESISAEMSLREIARENMKVLDVEAVVQSHVNSLGQPYNIDQIYDVRVEDENLHEPMYVYACSYEMTMDHGMITRLKLCRKNTIVSQGAALSKTT